MVEKLATFELKDAHCFDPNDEAKIRAAIAAGPGGAAGFEAVIRRLGRRLLECLRGRHAASEERQARSRTVEGDDGGEQGETGGALEVRMKAHQIVPFEGGEEGERQAARAVGDGAGAASAGA